MLKTTTTIICITSLMGISFLLGWSMRGDKIYGSMFQGYANLMPVDRIKGK